MVGSDLLCEFCGRPLLTGSSARPIERATEFGCPYIPCIDLCLSCLFEKEKATAQQIERLLLGSRYTPSPWGIQWFPGPEYDPEGVVTRLLPQKGEMIDPPRNTGAGYRWADFSVLMFGKRIDLESETDTSDAPEACFATGELMQRWLCRIRYRDTPLVIEERWDPVQGVRQSLCGLELAERREMIAALEGLRLLRELGSAGRPRGITNYSEAEFREALPRAFSDVKQRSGERPSRNDVAAELGISKATLGRYLNDWHIPWPPISE